ncbi:uncharacterized protein HHUB_2616 [Halobacterium hubeiense]|uniref:Uncharacterized protein n=1 Tax=Halobacterium hubeiense TaxID=1407499 RepID=A0A0U5H7A0_9EURY|nr:hypothetical protein [Halobacterium hubeiense]CQH57856.1 uncharacterized protein HHUB_2616 [Halobacterium hubeiense]
MSFRDPTGDTSKDPDEPSSEDDSRLRDDYPVSGVVNRVKVPNSVERSAVLADPSIETVMLSIDSARKLADIHDETARTYFREDQTVITTTTVHDDTLRKLDWREELDIVRRFGPDFHIPTEYSVYEPSMSPLEQLRAIRDSMMGTEWFAERLQNHRTHVFVQAKGWLPWHFRLCRPTMERLGEDFVVFYASGYEGRVHQPISDVETLVTELKPSGILIIGQQSVRFLKRAPPEVVAAAGGRWRKQSGLEDDVHEPKAHAEWKAGTEEKLGSGQALLNSFSTTKVTENG